MKRAMSYFLLSLMSASIAHGASHTVFIQCGGGPASPLITGQLNIPDFSECKEQKPSPNSPVVPLLICSGGVSLSFNGINYGTVGAWNSLRTNSERPGFLNYAFSSSDDIRIRLIDQAKRNIILAGTISPDGQRLIPTVFWETSAADGFHVHDHGGCTVAEQ
jgi:hypothetical protein